ncbi:MAG: hypothetical protein HRU26_03615, partial [Psychroserpens sp.]|nr:hypothetical protein [Psychroserpens sp.]
MKKIFYLFAISILFIGCSSNDDSSDADPNDPNNPNNTSNVFISATVNGASLTIFDNADTSDLTASLSIFDQGFILVVGGSRIVNQFDNEGLSVGITGPDFDEVDNGFEIDFINNQGYTVGGIYSYTPFGEEPGGPDFPLTSG